MNVPPKLEKVMNRQLQQIETGQPPRNWPLYSEEYYWDRLLEKPFRSIYATDGGKQPLIDLPVRNLSQTPREQCELDGFLKTGLEVEGPGQEVVVHGLKSAQELNGQRGRVLPKSGPGAPPAAPAAGRVAVRLVEGGKVVSCRKENLQSPHVPSSGTAAAAGGGGGGGASSSAAAGAPDATAANNNQQQQQQQGQHQLP
jgi:hypothetical protein